MKKNINIKNNKYSSLQQINKDMPLFNQSVVLGLKNNIKCNKIVELRKNIFRDELEKSDCLFFSVKKNFISHLLNIDKKDLKKYLIMFIISSKTSLPFYLNKVFNYFKNDVSIFNDKILNTTNIDKQFVRRFEDKENFKNYILLTIISPWNILIQLLKQHFI